MKRYLSIALATLLIGAGVLWASTIVYSGYLANESVAYDKAFKLDLKTAGKNGRSIDALAATVAYSSKTFSAASFDDGRLSTGSFTVSSVTDLTALNATNQITVTSTQACVNAIVYIYNGGQTKRLRAGYDFAVGADTNTLATNLAAKLNKVAGLSAAAVGNVVYATATPAGAAGNDYTFRIAPLPSVGLSTAAVSFSGGRSNAYVTVNGVTLTQGAQWTAADTASGTAKAISDAIMANQSLASILTSTWTAGGVVSATSTKVGSAYNVALVGSPASSIVRSAATMTGGDNSDYTFNGTNILKTSHGLVTALPVLYSTDGFTLGGLTDQTTYYVIRTDANNFGLAVTSTDAVAGNFITFTSSSTAGPHTFTLTPLTITGTFYVVWQTSDDDSTWVNMDVSSITFETPFTAGSASYDFGSVGHRYIRADVTAGTAGALDLQISATGRNDN